MKKVLISAFVIMFGAVGLVAAMPVSANAAPASDCNSSANFFSFPTWYRGLATGSDPDGQATPGNTDDNCKFDPNGKNPGEIVFIIALNVIDIALRIVAIMAVGFVIYGGFRYIISRGEPQDTKNALDTILKAVIGLAIAMVSAIVVSFLVNRLGQP